VTVEAILEAAARVLEREGVRRLTTGRVAEVAGVSVGSLYQYFPNKQAIAAALVERNVASLRGSFGALLEAVSDAPLDQVVEMVLRGWVALYVGQPKIHAELFDQLPGEALRQALEPALASYQLEIERFLERRRADRLVTDRAGAVFILVHAADGVLRALSTIHPGPDELERFIVHGKRMLLALLRDG
jgi:AcrR family transcriptional regulator